MADCSTLTSRRVLEVQGPTRAGPFCDKQPKRPILIQGDHGPIAIRRFIAVGSGTQSHADRRGTFRTSTAIYSKSRSVWHFRKSAFSRKGIGWSLSEISSKTRTAFSASSTMKHAPVVPRTRPNVRVLDTHRITNYEFSQRDGRVRVMVPSSLSRPNYGTAVGSAKEHERSRSHKPDFLARRAGLTRNLLLYQIAKQLGPPSP